MSRPAACTIVAKRSVAHARVLAGSFRAHHPEIPFFVVLADKAGAGFRPSAESYETIEIEHLSIPKFPQFRFRYSEPALSYAATPFVLTHLLDQGFDQVLFFKQESLVLGSHREVYERLEHDDVVLTPHVVSPLAGEDAIDRELEILQAGAYNAGLVAVSNKQPAREFLEWWQRRTLTHCVHDIRNGMHWEQRWLTLAPTLFEGVHILRDDRFNVGHWNLPDRNITVDGKTVRVNAEACRLFRFSGFSPDAPDRVTRHTPRLSSGSLGAAWLVFELFRTSLLEAGHEEASTWPYAWASFDNGIPIPQRARDIYSDLGAAVDEFGDPRTTSGRSFFEWLNEPVDGVAAPQERVTRLWEAAYRRRPDVRAAFPKLLGSSRTRFLAWSRTSGAREFDIVAAFIPGTWA